MWCLSKVNRCCYSSQYFFFLYIRALFPWDRGLRNLVTAAIPRNSASVHTACTMPQFQTSDNNVRWYVDIWTKCLPKHWPFYGCRKLLFVWGQSMQAFQTRGYISPDQGLHIKFSIGERNLDHSLFITVKLSNDNNLEHFPNLSWPFWMDTLVFIIRFWSDFNQ